MDYRGKVVVITGASSGIGYETARAFAVRGAVIVGVARREDRLKWLVGERKASRPARHTFRAISGNGPSPCGRTTARSQRFPSGTCSLLSTMGRASSRGGQKTRHARFEHP